MVKFKNDKFRIHDKYQNSSEYCGCKNQGLRIGRSDQSYNKWVLEEVINFKYSVQLQRKERILG